MYRLKCCLLAAGVVLAPALAPALAQAQTKPAFTADKIIQHFSDPAVLGGARGLGAQRAVCAGTEAECARASAGAPAGGGQSAQASASASSFDLMIQFNLDSDRLTDPARRNLDEFANALRDPRLKSFSFAVEGHTDARGTDDHNLDLSRRRAEAVVRYLEAKGVERARVMPKAFGSAQPRTTDPMDATNRRVETRLAQ
ncbi:MAG: OmpA family protein [Beijerinckiaceae bacterium]